VTPNLEDVERDEHGWGAQDARIGIAEEMEAAHELLVEDRDLAVQDQDVRSQLRHRGWELAREREEAVIRYLVNQHGIELRQFRAVAMGKVALGAGEKRTPEAFAEAWRVDIWLLAPWSSWEDIESQNDQSDEVVAECQRQPSGPIDHQRTRSHHTTRSQRARWGQGGSRS